MAFTGFYDAISLGLALKLFVLAATAAFTDNWHPAFFLRDLSPSMVLVMVLIFTGMLLALAALVALCLAIFITEGARTIAGVISGACAFAYAVALLLFSGSLASLASPWLLVMLTSCLSALMAHLVLILLKKLPDCPLFKLAMSSVMLLMAIMCVSLKHWWVVTSRTGAADAATVGLFSMPPGVAGTLVQTLAMLTLGGLVAMVGLFGARFAAAKAWVSADPCGEVLGARLGLGLSAACLACSVIASVAYSLVTHYTDSMLAAVCLADSGLGLAYQLLSSGSVRAQ